MGPLVEFSFDDIVTELRMAFMRTTGRYDLNYIGVSDVRHARYKLFETVHILVHIDEQASQLLRRLG